MVRLAVSLLLVFVAGCGDSGRPPDSGDVGSAGNRGELPREAAAPAWPAYSHERLADPPGIRFDNGRVEIIVALPDPQRGFYRGQRFDWSGIVTFAACDGQTFIGRWERDDAGQPVRRWSLGTSEEFKTLQPRGDWYKTRGGSLPIEGGHIGIGIGRMQRRTEAGEGRLRSWTELVEPFPWHVEPDERGVTFRQVVEHESGWGYAYEKRVQLAANRPAFAIHHELTNTGRRRLTRLHYSHHWLQLGGSPIGGTHRVVFPFEVEAHRGDPQLGDVSGRAVRFTTRLKDKAQYFAQLRGFTDATPQTITVENTTTGARMKISTAWPPALINLYASSEHVCPEPFFAIDLAPGEAARWVTTYVMEVQ